MTPTSQGDKSISSWWSTSRPNPAILKKQMTWEIAYKNMLTLSTFKNGEKPCIAEDMQTLEKEDREYLVTFRRWWDSAFDKNLIDRTFYCFFYKSKELLIGTINTEGKDHPILQDMLNEIDEIALPALDGLKKLYTTYYNQNYNNKTGVELHEIYTEYQKYKIALLKDPKLTINEIVQEKEDMKSLKKQVQNNKITIGINKIDKGMTWEIAYKNLITLSTFLDGDKPCIAKDMLSLEKEESSSWTNNFDLNIIESSFHCFCYKRRDLLKEIINIEGKDRTKLESLMSDIDEVATGALDGLAKLYNTFYKEHYNKTGTELEVIYIIYKRMLQKGPKFTLYEIMQKKEELKELKQRLQRLQMNRTSINIKEWNEIDRTQQKGDPSKERDSRHSSRIMIDLNNVTFHKIDS